MTSSFTRHQNRPFDEIRSIKIFYDALGFADASVLIELGNTKVLASVNLQQSVPPFLKGQKTGWLSAEYAMLPCATHQRTMRESSQTQRNSRSVEISRLIGRCLRTTVDLTKIGERTIQIDCDVLQADGSTRVAAITAASLALEKAIFRWTQARLIPEGVFKHAIAAVSVGFIEDQALLDLNYEEDSKAHADFNIIMTKEKHIIEIQGTAEQTPVTWQQFEQLKTLAGKGIDALFAHNTQNHQQNSSFSFNHATSPEKKSFQNAAIKPALFSLGNRIVKKES
ncbi:MAG: Ribonuclease PH [candidate division TM6 bacterium GW2011_GWF2_38_10]|nr:MAG: Ribonuclease PH [candidate division TM6 bacterium GW2011_GWF2_38_10]